MDEKIGEKRKREKRKKILTIPRPFTKRNPRLFIILMINRTSHHKPLRVKVIRIRPISRITMQAHIHGPEHKMFRGKFLSRLRMIQGLTSFAQTNCAGGRVET